MSAGVATGVIIPPVSASAAAVRPDARAEKARPDPVRFVGLMAQLGVLLVAFVYFDVEEAAFGVLAPLVVAGFAIHYWLPFAWKEPFYVLWSLAGAFVMLQPGTAAILIAAGLVLFGVMWVPLTSRARVTLIAVVVAALIYGRATNGFGIPFDFWPVFGSMFMFRFMVYVYDAAHAKGRPKLQDFLVYFYSLPNYYFLLFPVIDFQTQRQGYFRRNIHEVAQQGVAWMGRGAVQLLLYRLVYHWKGPSNAPDAVTSFQGLLATMTLTYLLYLRVSGQFHIIIGMLHLFGYDLPETHRKYLLSRSLTDFWRRINIYWKDFMVKLVYFPVYFRLRRSGEVRAQVVATVVVFVVTWLLHSYQWFWLRGEVLLTATATLFWAILGGLVTINLLVERRRPPKARAAAAPAWREPLQVAGTFCLIVTLWSLWNAPTVSEWLDLLTWWKVG